LVLLTFLRWLRQETDTEVQLMLWRGGPLAEAFAEVAEVTVLHPAPGQRSLAETAELGLGEVGLGGISGRLRALRMRVRVRPLHHDVLYLNGAGSALLAPHLRSSAPVLAHVHELSRGLRFSLRGPGRECFLGADRIVAVAQVVADLLVDDWGVDPGRVVVLPECLPDRVVGGMRGAATVTPGAPLVGSVGAGSWRKGVDLFLQVAAGVRQRVGPDVRFVWVGPIDDEEGIRSDVSALALDDTLTLAGEVSDPTPWFEAMSVFVSTAREDPFPLVALEAGAAGVPVVAFASGGITELLADGRGTVVAPLDVAAMADRVAMLLMDPQSGRQAADALRAQVATAHTIEQLGPALWAELEGMA